MTTIQLSTLLRQHRKNAELEQAELANRLNYQHASTVSRVESGERRPSKQYLQRFIKYLHLPPAEAQQLWDLYAGKPLTSLEPVVDSRWIEAPDVDLFYGRADEVARLKQWILRDQCRLIGIFGMGGIGKTMLASKVGWEVGSQFRMRVWYSLLNAPPVTEILAICFEAFNVLVEPSTSLNHQLRQFLTHLQQHRCLLVFDNVETILQDKTEPAGHYLPGYDLYGQLFRRLGESPHQSCVIITGREQPQEVTRLVGLNPYVRSLSVRGLTPQEGQQILQGKGLSGSPTAWAKLMARFSGNPMLLSIVANTIQLNYEGQIEAALADQATIMVSNVTYFMDEQFSRLSPLEQGIMYWLAIEREAVSPELLRNNMVDTPTMAALQAALTALQHRSLVERRATGFTMQNVLLEYMTKRLLDRMYQELLAGETHHFNHYALLKVQTKEYIRQIQSRLILEPLAEQLLAHFKSPAQVGYFLENHLANYRAIRPRPRGYFAGNMLNLMIHFQLDLTGLDFSYLTVWQADLRTATLHELNFKQADLSSSVFAETFDRILCLAFSPDGHQLATGTGKGEIRIWRVQDGKNLTTYPGHTDWVTAIVYSPDGRLLFSGCEGNIIRVWDAKTGDCLQIVAAHAERIYAMAISPDGRTLISGGLDKVVKVWQVDYHDPQSSSDPCRLTLQAVLPGHTKPIRGLAFHPNGHQFASSDQAIRLWCVETGDCLAAWEAHGKWATLLGFSPTGTYLASSGGGDDVVKLWDVNTQICRRTLVGHTSFVWHGSFSPDGQRLASGSRDGTIRIWHVETGQEEKRLMGHIGWVRAAQFSPDGQLLASSGEDKTLRLWETKRWRCTHINQGKAHWIRGLAFSPDNRTLASSGEDHLVRIWDMASGTCHRILGKFQRPIWAIAWHGDRLAVGNGAVIWLYDTLSWHHITTLTGHTGFVMRLAFSPDGRQLVSGSDDNTVRLWDVPTSQPSRMLTGHTEWLWDVAFSPEGQLVASCGLDRTIRLWRVRDGLCLRVLTDHTDIIHSVAFNPAGDRLVSASSDRTVRLWNLHTGECQRVLTGHEDQAVTAGFSASGQRVVSCGLDQTVRLWDADTGVNLQVMPDHQAIIWVGASSSDYRLFATACLNETIRVWDSETGEVRQILFPERPYQDMLIKQAIGLTAAQRANLKLLGAVEDIMETVPVKQLVTV